MAVLNKPGAVAFNADLRLHTLIKAVTKHTLLSVTLTDMYVGYNTAAASARVIQHIARRALGR